MKKIKAIFKGQNGSLGYKTNKEYTLAVRHSHVDRRIEIWRNDIGGDGWCEYSSFITFLQNWDNIRNL